MKRLLTALLLVPLLLGASRWDDVLTKKKSGSKQLNVMPDADVYVYDAGCTVGLTDTGTGTTLRMYSCSNITTETVEINGQTATVVSVDSATQLTLDSSPTRSEGDRILRTGSATTIYYDEELTTAYIQPGSADSNGRFFFYHDDAAFDVKAVLGSSTLILPDSAGGGDSVSIDGVSAKNPDLTSDGEVDPVRCTGSGTPHASCVSNEDVIFNFDLTATPTWSGVHVHAANVTMNDGAGSSPALSFSAESQTHTWSFFQDTASAGPLYLETSHADDRSLILSNIGAGDADLALSGDLSAGDATFSGDVEVSTGTLDVGGVTALDVSLYLGEQSAASADVTDYGQMWVKDDSPNTLWYTDEGGTDHQLGVGGGASDIDDLTGQSDIDEGFTFDDVTVDFDGGAEGESTVRLPNSLGLPGSCNAGDIYVDQDADAGDAELYVCNTTPQWKIVDDDGGEGGGFVDFDITDTDASPILTVDSTEQIQFIGGNNITVTAATDGANHDVTFDLDAAVDTTSVTADYFEDSTSGAASTGVVRLANNRSVTWRNQANSGDIAIIVGVDDKTLIGQSGAGVQIMADGTGNGELIVPDESIATLEILDDTILPADLDMTDTETQGYLVAIDSAGTAEFETVGLGDGLQNDGDNIDMDLATGSCHEISSGELTHSSDCLDSSQIDETDSYAWTTGAHTFAESIEIPNAAAAPTVDAAGEIAMDTDITSHNGLVIYYDGTTEMVIPAIPVADLTATDDHIIKFDLAGTKFTMEPDVSAGSPTFLDIATGTNTQADMIVSTGATMSASGTGTIVSTGVDAVGAGAILIGSPDVTEITIDSADLSESIVEADLEIIADGEISATELNADVYADATLTGILTLPVADAPSTTLEGELAVDREAIGSTRDAIEFYDGDESTYLVGYTGSDIPGSGEVLKYQGDGTFKWDPDATGGEPALETINDPVGATDFEMDGTTETIDWLFSSAFTGNDQFTIRQATGNPTGGTLFSVKAADTNVTVMHVGDGTNGVEVSQAGEMAIVGTGDIEATDIRTGSILSGDATVSGDWNFTDTGTTDFAGAVTGTSFTADPSDTAAMTLTTSSYSGAQVSIGITGATGPEATMDINVDEGGVLTKYIELDGVTEQIEFEKAVVGPSSTWDITAAGEISAVSYGEIAEENLVDKADTEEVNGQWSFTGGLAVPQSAAPTTNATGEIALDTTITGHQPLLQYYDGGANMTVIAIDTTELPALNDEIVKYDSTSDKFVLEPDAGTASNVPLSGIQAATETNAIDSATYAQVWEWDTDNTTAAVFNALEMRLNYDADTTDSGNQTLLLLNRINNAVDANGQPEQMLRIQNLDTDDPVAYGVFVSAAAGGITTAIDVSDAEISTALAIGSNDVTMTTGTLAETELAELLTIDSTTISAAQWAALGGIAETLTSGELDTLDGITSTVTELNYTDGVTSAIQTQLGAKEDTLTNSAGLLAALSDETGSGLSVFGTSPTFTTSVNFGSAGVILTDDGDGAIRFTGLGDGADEDLNLNFDDTVNEITFSSSTDVDTLNFIDNSISTADLKTEVRSMYWGAGAISTDGTECSDPAEATINSGPKLYTIACPMTTSETNGVLYGSTVMPDSYDGGTFTLELTAYMTTDADSGTLHTEAFAMCRTDDTTINSTWGTSIDIDLVTVAGDAVNEILTATSAAITGDSCAAGEMLFWKIEICDTDATPDGNCTSSAGLENDFSMLGVKMEYTSDIGD